MIKKILLITLLCLILSQGIALATFKVWVSPDFSPKTPLDVKKGEVKKGVITVKNQNDFTIKGQAQSSVTWASIVPNDFNIAPANELKLYYTINTPNQEGTVEGAFNIVEWGDDSTEGIGMTGKYSTVIPFTLQVQGEGVQPETTAPIESEPKYFLSTNFILAVISIIIACIVAIIFLESQKKTAK